MPAADLQASLSLLDWLRLLGASLLFLGPGCALFSFYPDRVRFDKTQTIAAGVALSLSFWAVLLVWLHLFGLAVKPIAVFIILAAGWAVALIRMRPSIGLERLAGIELTSGNASRIALWGILLVVMATGVWAFRDTVFGLGIDSYHHTLIAQMIASRGILPDDYQPFAPLVSFTYHFGFHSFVAALSWLAGLPIPALVVPAGQILDVAAVLSVAFFTQIVTRSPVAAAVSATCTGLISVVPFYFANWGRYTQLTGLVILPVFLGLIWHWLESGSKWPSLVLIATLAAGMALAHYRITLMAAIAVLVFVGLDGFIHRANWARWRQMAGHMILAGALAGLLILPWIWRLMSAGRYGYPVDVGSPPPTSTYYSLSRLGPGVLKHPTNALFLGSALLGAVLGWWRRKPAMIALSIWTMCMLLGSSPRLAGTLFDRISVIVSLYFPAAVVVGWVTMVVVQWLAARWRPSQWLAWLGLLGLVVWGSVAVGSTAAPSSAFVRRDDLPAMAWIQSNTPESAYFLVNTYTWDFVPRYVVGSDAGYWIPLLAGRRTVTLPMTYVMERAASPDLVDRLVALDLLDGELTSPQALALLTQEGITHVYIGARGGPIVVDELLRSPAFELEYQNGSAYVFRFVASR